MSNVRVLRNWSVVVAFWVALIILAAIALAQREASSFEFEAVFFKWCKIALKWRRRVNK
jgi:hypothetical protein